MPAFKQRRRGFQPIEHALGFVTGILAGARKLTHVAHLRSDVMLGRLLAIAGIPSQSSFSRLFQRLVVQIPRLAVLEQGSGVVMRICQEMRKVRTFEI